MADNPRQPERPRTEPEIIPPDHSGRPSDWDRAAWRSSGPAWTGATQRIYVGRLGPLGFAVLLLVFAVVAAILFLAILGAALIWLPIILLAAVVAAFFRLWRR
jgi:hypothetical protein